MSQALPSEPPEGRRAAPVQPAATPRGAGRRHDAHGATAFLAGAEAQLRVVHALIMREVRTRFGAHRMGYLWAVLEPLLWIGSFWAMFTIAQRRIPHHLDALAFLATGILPYEIFASNVNRISEAINGNRGLLFYPLVKPVDLVWSRAVLETSTLLTVFVIIVGGAALVRGEFPVVDDPLRSLMGFALAALLGVGLGLVLCMTSVVSKVVERLRKPMLRPLFWVSGLFFTADNIPEGARPYLELNPVLHAVELVRDGWFADYEAPSARPGYALAFALVLIALGLWLERLVRRKVELS